MQVDERIRGHLVDAIPARDDEASRMRQAWERAQAAKAKSQAGGSAGRGAGGWDGKPSEGHPEFLDGKGKLFDSKSKTWKSINQSVPARHSPAGAEYVNKTFPESGNRWERGFCSTPFCVSSFASGSESWANARNITCESELRLRASFVSDRVCRYEGEMVGGKYHGKGKLTYADGRKYDGTWHEGVMHGKGTFRFANGDGEPCKLLQHGVDAPGAKISMQVLLWSGLPRFLSLSPPSPPLYLCALPDLPDSLPPPQSLRRGVFWRETAGTRQARVDEWGCL